MSPYAKLYRTVMALSFAVFIGCVALINLISPDHPFSLTENRVLEQMPGFSLQRLLSGQFTADFERYIADQFVGRDAWIGIRSSAELALGKKENNGVYVAADGTLIQAFSPPDEAELADKVEAINSFAAAFPQIDTYLMLVPNAVEILEEKLPRYAPVPDQSAYLDQVRASVDERVHFVDVHDTLYARRDEYLYYRTDHHWTTLGSYYAYQRLAEEMGESPQPREAYEVRTVTQEFFGTSQSKSGFHNVQPDAIELYIPKSGARIQVAYLDSDQVTDSPYSLDRLEGKDKYAVFLDGTHGLVKISSDADREKRLLVVKDSYANALVPFLTSHFGEIYVVDLRYFDDDLPRLILRSGITDLLFLYNLDTFCTDASVFALADYAVEAVAQQASMPTLVGSSEGGYERWFRSDLFIGDSITEGLAYYEFLPEEVVAASKGLDFRTVRDDLELVRDRQPRNIYVLLGINVIGKSKESLVEQYVSFIRDLRQAAPQARIHVQSILPVEPWVKEEKPALDQEHIDECNEALQEMAEQEQIQFVNIAEVADAKLHEVDGIHFRPDFYPLWLDYLVRETKIELLQGGS